MSPKSQKSLKLKKGDRANFKTLQRAATDDSLALMSCQDKATGKYVAVVCAVNYNGEDEEFEMVPIAKLFTGNPYDELISPID